MEEDEFTEWRTRPATREAKRGEGEAGGERMEISFLALMSRLPSHRSGGIVTPGGLRAFQWATRKRTRAGTSIKPEARTYVGGDRPCDLSTYTWCVSNKGPLLHKIGKAEWRSALSSRRIPVTG